VVFVVVLLLPFADTVVAAVRRACRDESAPGRPSGDAARFGVWVQVGMPVGEGEQALG